QVSAERILGLIDRARRPAMEARSAEKRRLLARIVVAGADPAGSDAQVERAYFLIDIAANLERPHIEVLRVLANPPLAEYASSFVNGWTAEGLTRALPELG